MRVPFIRLSGKWLERAGFEAGHRIAVHVQKGSLVIEASPS
jgi:hypothetical protein